MTLETHGGFKNSLTNRELEIMNLFKEGITGHKIIAKRFGTSPSTVGNQISDLYQKLGVYEEFTNETKVIRAINAAIRMGIISGYEPPIDETKTQIFRDGARSLGIEID